MLKKMFVIDFRGVSVPNLSFLSSGLGKRMRRRWIHKRTDILANIRDPLKPTARGFDNALIALRLVKRLTLWISLFQVKV